MTQLTEEQRERVKQIRDRFGTSRATWQDVGFLLSLLDSDSQAAEPDYRPETMNAEKDKAPERPKRVWITWDDAYPWPTPEMGGDEYVHVDLLATARKEAREAAFREAVNWAKKVHGVKVNAANDAAADDEFAAMRLGHEADGVQRVIDTLEAALERAATDTDKTERG